MRRDVSPRRRASAPGALTSGQPAVTHKRVGVTGRSRGTIPIAANHRDGLLRLARPVRLARRRLHVADNDGRVPLNQSQLAEFVGSTREAVSKTLNRWRREGHLAAERGPIRLVAPQALSEIADDADFSARM